HLCFLSHFTYRIIAHGTKLLQQWSYLVWKCYSQHLHSHAIAVPFQCMILLLLHFPIMIMVLLRRLQRGMALISSIRWEIRSLSAGALDFGRLIGQMGFTSWQSKPRFFAMSIACSKICSTFGKRYGLGACSKKSETDIVKGIVPMSRSFSPGEGNDLLLYIK